MHILHSVLNIFPKGLKGEFVQQSRLSIVADHFLFLVTFMCNLGMIL